MGTYKMYRGLASEVSKLRFLSYVGIGTDKPLPGRLCSNRQHTDDSSALFERKYTPRRAIMYVPGNDERKLQKISSVQPDCAVLDCEDGVALNKKAEARETIRNILDTRRIQFGKTECSVRVNSVESGLCEEDLTVILSAQHLPSTIHIPKVESCDQLEWFSDKFQSLLQDRGKPHMNLIMFIESARALLDLPNICQRAKDLSTKGYFISDGLVLGSDDLCADIGATRTNEAKELLYARQYLVLVAKAYRLQAIDIVYIDYKDLDGLRHQSLEGAAMGFTGKQVIHPSQVPVVQEAYSPTASKVEWAKSLIEAFEHHQKSGKGAFNFRGSMIDMPLLLQARNVLDTIKAIEGHKLTNKS